MRAAPVGLFYHQDPEKLREAAHLAAQITHAHPLGKEEAALQACGPHSPSETTRKFHDLKNERWANKFTKLAADKGYLRGKGNSFLAPKPIMGAEVTAVLTRVGGLAGPEGKAGAGEV